MKDKTKGAPSQVKAVYSALLKNAEKVYSEFAESVVSCYTSGKEWRVGSNFEDGHHTMIFRDDKWFTRSPWSGEDTEMRHGFNEAIGTANIYFTG